MEFQQRARRKSDVLTVYVAKVGGERLDNWEGDRYVVYVCTVLITDEYRKRMGHWASDHNGTYVRRVQCACLVEYWLEHCTRDRYGRRFCELYGAELYRCGMGCDECEIYEADVLSMSFANRSGGYRLERR